MHLWQKIAQIPALALAILGMFGPDTLWQYVQPYVDTEWGRRFSIVLGALFLIPVYGNWLAKRLSQRTPAQISKWDHISTFKIWQVAWLWNDLEPENPETSGTVVSPTFLRLEEDLTRGRIKDVKKIDDSWVFATATRQVLVDYAYAIREKPKFLFKETRRPLSKLVNWMSRREMDDKAAHEFTRLSDLYIGLHGQSTVQEIAGELTSLLRQGKARSIGRPLEDGITRAYQEIPARAWQNLRIDFTHARSDTATFQDIRVKFPKQDEQRQN